MVSPDELLALVRRVVLLINGDVRLMRGRRGDMRPVTA
jgi:hypothetical protein